MPLAYIRGPRAALAATLLAVLAGFAARPTAAAQATYELRAAGGTGELLERTAVDAAGRPVLVELFQEGRPQRRTAFERDAAGRVTREVATLFDDHEYDLIKEYAYDGEGRVVNLLTGNNRSGRWGSEGYVYDAHGHLERVDHFRKDGSLAYETRFALEHDGAGRLTAKTRTKHVLPVDSLHDDWENEVAIGRDAVPEPGEVEEAFAKTEYVYAAGGRLAETVETDRAGAVRMRTTYTPLEAGLRRERTTYYGSFGGVDFAETVDYDALDRPVRRSLLQEETTYRYFGETDVLRGVTVRRGGTVAERRAGRRTGA